VKGRGLLWPAVLPAAVLLWLPVLLFELVHPWTPREVLASPALLRLLALAAASATMVTGLLVGGGGAPGSSTPTAAGAISSAATAGCLLLLLAAPVHALAQGAGWAPEAGYAALLITSVLFSCRPRSCPTASWRPGERRRHACWPSWPRAAGTAFSW
jgi:hypothetical protein